MIKRSNLSVNSIDELKNIYAGTLFNHFSCDVIIESGQKPYSFRYIYYKDSNEYPDDLYIVSPLFQTKGQLYTGPGRWLLDSRNVLNIPFDLNWENKTKTAPSHSSIYNIVLELYNNLTEKNENLEKIIEPQINSIPIINNLGELIFIPIGETGTSLVSQGENESPEFIFIQGGSGTSGIPGTSGTSGSSGTSGTSPEPGEFIGDASDIVLGLPSDGDLSGIVELTPETSICDAIDNLNEILTAISPSPPENLLDKSLILSNTTLFSAKLPAGLSDSWYIDSSPGDIINNYVIDNTFNLRTPNPENCFSVGKFSEPSGIINLNINNETILSRDLQEGEGTTQNDYYDLSILSISLYNSIWAKCQVHTNIHQIQEGLNKYNIEHSKAGKSNDINIRYDDIASNPSFSEIPTINENSINWKYLSGIKYYGYNSTFNLNFKAASGIFTKAIHPNRVAYITMNPSAMDAISLNPLTIPNYNDEFIITNQLITLNIQNISGQNPYIQVRLYKPDNKQVFENISLDYDICTYNIISTLTSESFYDENKRLQLNTNLSWDSTQLLINGNAQVKNGILQYPNSIDYPDFTGDQEYQRKFTKASASTGTLTFNNIVYTDISSYGNGNLNVLLYLENENLYFDLGKVVGDNNGNGSGTSRSDSLGCRTSAINGSISFSLGLHSTANNNNEYRVIIIFKSSVEQIKAINSL